MFQSVLIVEDEVVIAEDIKELLQENGIANVTRVSSKNEAFEILSKKTFELILLDIKLSHNNYEGLEIAQFIKENTQSKIIFLTSYSNQEIVEKITVLNPIGYILKPINSLHLLASIKIAFNQYSKDENKAIEAENNEINLNSSSITFKENKKYSTIKFNDILWIKSDKNYIEIITIKKRHIIRCSLSKMRSYLPSDKFHKCHKSIVINISKVDEFTQSIVVINGTSIPISRQNKNELLLALGKNSIHLKA